MNIFCEGYFPNEQELFACSNFSQKTAINSSWICITYPSRGWAEPECFFTYIQQFYRISPLSGIIEAAVLASICLASVPCNIIAVVNFKLKKVTEQFSLLIAVLAVCNVTLTSLGFIAAGSRLIEDWTFGELGCPLFYGGSLFSLSLSVWVMVLISFERYFSVQSHDLSQSMRISSILWILLLLILLDVAIWWYPYVTLEIAQVLPVTIDRDGADAQQVNICSLFTYRLPNGGMVQSLFMFAILFGLPILITAVNYWKMVLATREANLAKPTSSANIQSSRKSVVSLANVQHGHVVTFSPPVACPQRQSAARFSSSNLPDSAVINDRFTMYACMRLHSRETYLAHIMAVSMFLFTISNLPLHLVTAYIATRNSKNPEDLTVNSSAFVAALFLLYLNATVNPLLHSFSSKLSLIGNRRRSSGAVIKITAVKPPTPPVPPQNDEPSRQSVGDFSSADGLRFSISPKTYAM